jgi:hypothetical protein
MNLLSFFLSLLLFVTDAEPGEIRGRISDSGTGEALAGVNVMLQNTTTGTVSGSDGTYIISGVKPGVYIVEVRLIGFETRFMTDVVVSSNRKTYLDIPMAETVIEGQEVTVTGGYFSGAVKDPGLVSFNPEEIRRSPGAAQELSRVLMALPSVASRGESSQDMMVRGGSPIENGFIIDNIQVPGVSHFRGANGISYGPIGIVNTELVSNLDFYSGGFSARYGDRLSSFSEVSYREGTRNGFRGDAAINMAGFGLNLEKGIAGGKGSLLVSSRRSYLDLIADAINAGGAPAYSDAQVKVSYDLSKNHRLSVLNIYGNSFFDQDAEAAKEIGDGYYLSSLDRQNTFGANLRSLWKGGFTNTSLSHSFNKNEFKRFLLANDARIVDMDQRLDEVRLRSVSVWEIARNASLEAGIDAAYESGSYTYFFAADVNRVGQATPEFRRNNTLTGITGGAFASLIVQTKSGLKLTGGMRAESNSYNNNIYIAPRLSAVYALSPIWNLSASAGVFHQTLPRYLVSQNENLASLDNTRARHLIAGTDFLISADTRISVEFFDKQYTNAPVLPSNNTSSDPAWVLDGAAGFYDALNGNGNAWARGIEVLVQKKLAVNFYGMVSASYFRTRYEDFNGKWRDRDFDNRTLFSVIGGYRPGKNWELSARWTYLGRRPTTPLELAASESANLTRLDAASYNTDQLPAFHSMYLRGDRRFFYNKTSLVVYLELWNAYNRQNVNERFWNQNTQNVDNAYQFSLLPVMGAKFEF